jgi:hypothetical protein
MPHNIEIKPRVDTNLNDLIEWIQPIADGPPRSFTQNASFFNCLSGERLELKVEEEAEIKLKH